MFLDAEQLGKRHDETIVFTTIRQEYFAACCSIAFAERKATKSTMGAAAATAPVLPSLAAATLPPCTGVQILTDAINYDQLTLFADALGDSNQWFKAMTRSTRPLVDHHHDLVELVGLCAQKLQMKVEVKQCKPAERNARCRDRSS